MSRSIFIAIAAILASHLVWANDTQCKEAYAQHRAPFGFIYIEQSEMAQLEQQPLIDLANARAEFASHEYAQASEDIHSASVLMKIQAASGVKGSQLKETADRLEDLSKRVGAEQVPTSAALDLELSQAARNVAQHHYLRASELWFKRMAQNTGNDLRQAVAATKKSVEWSGREISKGGSDILNSSEKLSQKLVDGGKWTSKEVGHGISALGKEMSALGKDMEPGSVTKPE